MNFGVFCFGLLVYWCDVPKTAPQVITACPVIAKYSKDFQAGVLREYDALPANARLRITMKEWYSLRQQVRACRSVGGKT
jgi:hypothetical protein